MALSVDFYYDISCPWAYIASTQSSFILNHFLPSVEHLCARAKAKVEARPVLLGAIFKANSVPHDGSFADTLGETKRKNQSEDLLRMLKFYNVPVNWPSVYPTRSVKALRCVLARGWYFSNKQRQKRAVQNWWYKNCG
jgi:2-hydroxychromene-2-carboxylate isomerase